MTCNTDESIDPYKISISSENSLDDYVKRRFETGLSALLAHPYFLLLHVPENGAKMQIVKPAQDSYHRERIVKRISEAKGVPSFYYALSHLWGISKDDPQLWEEIGEHVNDIDEQPAEPVSMRPEKRNTLLGLLKDHPDSYWWIDVLCARTDTPLDIMGDIYRCCLECIAMIDCEPGLLSKLHTKPNKRKEFFDMDWYNAMKEPSPEDLLYLKQQYDKHPELLYDLVKLQQSEWWNRVWTWQEMALPFGDVRLMAETGIQQLQSDTITVDDLVSSFINAIDIMFYVSNADEVDAELVDAFNNFRGAWMMEISQTRDFSKHDVKKNHAYQFAFLLDTLGESTRRCMDPVDYVYGVLGMLNIKIPRMTEPKAVWQRFLSELDNYMDMADIKSAVFYMAGCDGVKVIGIQQSAYKIDLQQVECMGDVYNKVLDMEKIYSDKE
ncbi:hypothetical protein K492DRAFT_183931 [Lichtheimia hyalospora FSU 10163]|nr:hypothetical protein K492DRAFT_183931 [Lichtheimia hyalospora FSU 10163]